MNLEYIVYINQSADKVFRALVEAKFVKQLYYGSQIVGELSPGSDFAYIGPGVAGDKTEHILGRVIHFEPGKRFCHSCQVSPIYGAEHVEFESRVNYSLETLHPCLTKLTLTHTEWQPGDPSYENTKEGWWLFLSSLKSLLETGKPIELTAMVHG